MEIDIFAIDGDKVIGKVRVGTSATPPCSSAWESIAGVMKGEKVFARYDISGRCGKAELTFWIDQGAKTVITGTYSSEYPDEGEIRLTKE